MNTLHDISLRLTYNKAEHDIAEEFYLPCMASSARYDRMSGYFGSTIYIIAWGALKEFVHNGGKMRIICSPCLSNEDLDAIQKGQKAFTDESLKQSLEAEISRLFNSDELRKPYEVLAYLISQNIVEIRIAYGINEQTNVKRLFHDKVGIFQSSSDAVSFTGSVNETYKGLSDDGNSESITVFSSWQSQTDALRIAEHQKYFDDLWNNNLDKVIVTPIPSSIRAIISKHVPSSSWEELVDEINSERASAKKWSAEANHERKPRKHQADALNKWVKNGHKGIFEHATGSGKTYTSLCAIRYAISNGKTVLILVPSADLLKQWFDEVNEVFSDLLPNILTCGDGNVLWKKNNYLHYMTTPDGKPKIVISTMDTAVMPDFLKSINEGEHLFVVADEVHRMGSPSHRKFFNTVAGYKLGVSATPRRYGDPEGTEAIISYFGNILQPPYTLQDAIRNNVLTPYYYWPSVVRLEEEEQNEWNTLSKQISQRYAIVQSKNLKSSDDRSLQSLLLRRANIIKNANGKVQLAVDILSRRYERGQRWIVYCQDKAQLHEVAQAIHKQLPKIDLSVYYADMDGSREETLKSFALDGGVIVSIKCLDEGIDIPAASHAIILASSKNPREFIQRRGRVLRKHPSKLFSYIFDAIVIPADSNEVNYKADSLIGGELSRAIQFASWADTSYGTDKLKIIAFRNKFDINSLINDGNEED